MAFPTTALGPLTLADTKAVVMFSIVGSVLAVTVGATRIAVAEVRGLAGALEARVEERTEELGKA